jgi:fimbrial chaperone protein
MPHRAWSTRAAPLISAALLAASPAQRSGLQVAPVAVTLTAAKSSDGLTLSNVGNAPLHAQVRVYRWEQGERDSEVIAPTGDLIVSPPMIVLQPGGRQLVRVIRASSAPQAGAPEATYRIVIDELPITGDGKGDGLNFVLRYTLPAFVLPAGPAVEPELKWGVIEIDGTVALTVTNSGGRHAQVADVALLSADGTRTVLAPGLLGYALPGVSRTWTTAVPWSASVQNSTLEVRINGQEASLPVAGYSDTVTVNY